MCKYIVGDLVHYDADPVNSHVYIVTYVNPGFATCEYNIELTITPFTVYDGIPQRYLVDTLDDEPKAGQVDLGDPNRYLVDTWDAAPEPGSRAAAPESAVLLTDEPDRYLVDTYDPAPAPTRPAGDDR